MVQTEVVELHSVQAQTPMGLQDSVWFSFSLKASDVFSCSLICLETSRDRGHLGRWGPPHSTFFGSFYQRNVAKEVNFDSLTLRSASKDESRGPQFA